MMRPVWTIWLILSCHLDSFDWEWCMPLRLRTCVHRQLSIFVTPSVVLFSRPRYDETGLDNLIDFVLSLRQFWLRMVHAAPFAYLRTSTIKHFLCYCWFHVFQNRQDSLHLEIVEETSQIFVAPRILTFFVWAFFSSFDGFQKPRDSGVTGWQIARDLDATKNPDTLDDLKKTKNKRKHKT